MRFKLVKNFYIKKSITIGMVFRRFIFDHEGNPYSRLTKQQLLVAKMLVKAGRLGVSAEEFKRCGVKNPRAVVCDLRWTGLFFISSRRPCSVNVSHWPGVIDIPFRYVLEDTFSYEDLQNA